MEIFKYGLAHVLAGVAGLEIEATDIPPSRPPTPVTSVGIRLTEAEEIIQVVRSPRGPAAPLLPSPTHYLRFTDGQLVLMPSPRKYYRDATGQLLPLDEYEESDFDMSDEEDYEMLDLDSPTARALVRDEFGGDDCEN